MERAYRNLGYFLLALPLAMLAGFWIPYFSAFPHFDANTTAAVHLHALLLFSWVALLAIQPLAIRRGAFATHRALGRTSYVLMPLIVISAVAMVYKEYLGHRADGLSATASLKAEYLSLVAVPILAALYGLAIWRILRRDVPRHMRYMICIAFVLLPAGLARTLGYWFEVKQWRSQVVCFAVIDLSLMALILLERRRGAIAGPYVAMLLTYLLFEAGWVALGFPV
jgi:hypothetical protein